MELTSQHYVPVLKMKRGEKRALTLIPPMLKRGIVPLFEVVKKTKDSLEDHLNTSFKSLAEGLHGYPHCFLDVHELKPEGSYAADAVFNRAAREGITFIPVSGISRDFDIEACLEHSEDGIAIRLQKTDCRDDKFPDSLRSLLNKHSLEPGVVDLIVDMGAIKDMIIPGVISLVNELLDPIPDKRRWRSLIISGSAFPKSMGIVDSSSFGKIPRLEWIAWRNLFRSRSLEERIPTFSDCAIQHPVGVEDFDPRLHQVSASIRYCMPEDWLLIKGISTRRAKPTVQFPQLATQLVYGIQQMNYYGRDHCEGCRSIKYAADGVSGYGSAEAWRKIGTIHHLVTVMQAISSLHAI